MKQRRRTTVIVNCNSPLIDWRGSKLEKNIELGGALEKAGRARDKDGELQVVGLLEVGTKTGEEVGLIEDSQSQTALLLGKPFKR